MVGWEQSEKVFEASSVEALEAFARITYKSVYVLDLQAKGFSYVSENPLFLCGHSAEEVRDMGYQFYSKHVKEEDLDLLREINSVGLAFYDKIPLVDRTKYIMSYDYHIDNRREGLVLVNQKFNPLFLTERGRIWRAICIVSLSTEKDSGNLKVYCQGGRQIHSYNRHTKSWKTSTKSHLTLREKQILHLCIKGYTIDQIAQEINLAVDTIKYHRSKLFEKLGVSNISEAIVYSLNNELF